MKRSHSFQVEYLSGAEGDISILVQEEDLIEVRKLCEPALVVAYPLNLDAAKKEIAEVIDNCLQTDNDSAYLISLINSGHAPNGWTSVEEEILYATEDPDNEDQILLHVKAPKGD